jgi:hypothetical protein
VAYFFKLTAIIHPVCRVHEIEASQTVWFATSEQITAYLKEAQHE